MGMLDGKTAIITGAGQGIGKAVALGMAQAGANVVVNDIGASLDGKKEDKGLAETVVNAIQAAGGKAVSNTDSVAEFSGAGRMVQQAMDSFGDLHIVVNNAGILRDRMLHKMSPDDWHAVVGVHLGGHFNVCRASINHFREKGYGRIVNFTSTSGIVGNLGQTNYGAAKMGIFAFTRILALETMRYDICVNAIAPFAFTRMTDSVPVKDELGRAKRERTMKMRVEDIAPLAVYLSSAQAKGVTGQIFGARASEIILFSQPRPQRSVHKNGGWSPEEVGASAMKALKPFFEEPKVSAQVFPYDPLV